MSDYEEIPLWVDPPSTPDPVSRAAARSMKVSAASLRRAVLMAIRNHEPIAAWELEELLQMAGDTLRPRVWELEKAGMVERVAERGRTPSGRACYQYVVTTTGREALR